jgi:hypothetical protein
VDSTAIAETLHTLQSLGDPNWVEIITLVVTTAYLVATVKIFLATKEANKHAERAIEAQDERFEIQRFEETFFRLLERYESIVNRITTPPKVSKNDFVGRRVFEQFYNQLKSAYTTVKRRYRAEKIGIDKEHRPTLTSDKTVHPDTLDPVDLREVSVGVNEEYSIIDSVYSQNYSHAKPQLGYYFDHVERTLKYIIDSEIEDKGFYLSLLTAQFSTYEKVVLFYHGATVGIGLKLGDAVEEANLPLQILQDAKEKLLDESHLAFYEPEGYLNYGEKKFW